MLGVIITGHGHFATGLKSAIELVAGQQDKFEAIDFKEGLSSENLYKELKDSIDKLNSEEGIVIFTDIPGGTPFNQSVMLSTEINSIRVIAGTNIPTIMEGIFYRNNDVDTFVNLVLDAGKNGLQVYQDKEIIENKNENGI